MGILLDKDELEAIVLKNFYPYQQYFRHQAIAKAQLKKVGEWGRVHCVTHHTRMNNVLHRDCNECWQALLKGIE